MPTAFKMLTVIRPFTDFIFHVIFITVLLVSISVNKRIWIWHWNLNLIVRHIALADGWHSETVVGVDNITLKNTCRLFGCRWRGPWWHSSNLEPTTMKAVLVILIADPWTQRLSSLNRTTCERESCNGSDTKKQTNNTWRVTQQM